jgi:hypothetical protein
MGPPRILFGILNILFVIKNVLHRILKVLLALISVSAGINLALQALKSAWFMVNCAESYDKHGGV